MSIAPAQDWVDVDPSARGISVPPLAPRQRRYAMSLLLGICIVNYLDRSVINILAEPIKRDLHLADWQLGMMSGLAFSLLYTLLGVPIARLAERGNRPWIIAVAAAVWSAFTALSGFAQSFWQLALVRVGVGVGEAGCTPPAFSLIVDYAPPEKRSSALAFYGLGPHIGGLLGMMFGGLVADAYGWRTAFLIAGAPGLLFAGLAALFLPEPRRALADWRARGRAASATFGETVRLLASRRSFRFLAAAITIAVFVSIGYMPFIASFYLRNHAAQLAEAARATGAAAGFTLGPIGFLGLALGLANGVGAALGTWSGGVLADRFGPADPRRYLLAPAVAALIAIPVFLAAIFADSLWVSLCLYGVHAFIASIWYGPSFAAALSVAPPHMRATSTALLLFLSGLFGLGLAPLTVGVLSDALGAHYGPADGLRYALATLILGGVVTAALFATAARTLREDLESGPALA